MANLRSCRRGFTLVELVIVVVIIGIISAIAIPRMASAGDNSRISTVKASLKILDTAAEMFAAEHDGLLPCDDPDGSANADADAMLKRLLQRTAADGTFTFPVFGPYLRDMPLNPYNGLNTVRIDGAPAGTKSAGWRFDSARRRFQADDPVGAAIGYEIATGNKPESGGALDGDAIVEGALAAPDDGQ